MDKYNHEKTINGLSVERRNRLASANTSASAMGLSFMLISEHMVANTPETDKLIEELEETLKDFEKIRKDYNSKLESLSGAIFNKNN